MQTTMKRLVKTKRWGIAAGGVVVACVIMALILFSSGLTDEHTSSVVAVGSPVLNPMATMTYFEDKVQQDPGNMEYRLGLAQVYLQYAVESREESTYLPKAEDHLGTILQKYPEHFEAIALQATLYNMLHQFEKARDMAYLLIERNGDRAFVYGILVDALVELGEYDEAVRVCDEMIGVKPGLTSYARASYLRELHGDTKGAIDAMRLAAGAGMPGSADRSWALYQLGQLLLAEDNVHQAAKLFEGILEERHEYAFALGGLGQVQLINGDYEGALTLFESAYARVPADEFLEGMVEAHAALNNEDEMQAVLKLIEEQLIEADEMGENVRMEYADFLADIEHELPRALTLAQLEYERRPSHLHALETYAWTLHKTGQSARAMAYIDQAMRLSSNDAMVSYRAARIYQAANQPELARFYLMQALDANLHIESPSTAREAQELFATLS